MGSSGLVQRGMSWKAGSGLREQPEKSDYPHSISNTRIAAALEEPRNLSEVPTESSASGDTGGAGVHSVLPGNKSAAWPSRGHSQLSSSPAIWML